MIPDSNQGNNTEKNDEAYASMLASTAHTTSSTLRFVSTTQGAFFLSKEEFTDPLLNSTIVPLREQYTYKTNTKKFL